MTRLWPVVAVAALLVTGCGGDDADGGACAASDAGLPVVGDIDAAIEAVDRHYGAPQEFFEVSADLARVSVIVAVDGASAAEQGYFAEGRLEGPTPVGEAEGATFAADAVDFDECTIFDRIRDELDDPVIVDFAIQGGPDGAVVYDATVASDSGGRILVLLAPDGEILGAQAVE